MQAWPVRRMDDLCEITSSKRIFAADYVSAGVPFYRGREVTEKYKGNLDVSTELFITEEKFAEIERKFGAPRTGDLLLTSVGTLGSVYVVKPGDRFYFKDGNLTWFRHFKGLDSHFLYYWIGSPMGKAELQKCTIGSSQSAFTIVLLKGMEIRLPPLPVQRRIASIFSAYDDLIENSQRRIKILESMARALYRKWFVHFRFPGHENHPRVASPLGEIPEGWEVRRIDEALRFDSGRTIKKEERENGNTPVYGANGIIGGTANAAMADKGIIMGKIGSCGALHRSHVPCWVTNNAFLVQPAAIQSWELAWQALLDIDFRQYVGGAANPYMPINTFGQHEVLVPTAGVQAEFQKRAAPLRILVETLSERIDNLRRTRDLLLPRLLSGQIALDELEAA